MSSSPTGGTTATTGSNQSIARETIGGAVAGAAAYLLGYLAVYVTQSGRVEEGLSGINFFADLFGDGPISVWRGVGWVFYNAHFVDIEVPSLIGAAQSVNFISQSEGGMTYLFVLPPLLLVVAGVVVGRAANASTPVAGARSGALITAGYLPLALIGAFLFRYTVGDGSVTPDIVTAVLLAGAVYPAVFGAIGGTVSSLLSD